ncbi:hypothetical protein DFH06DRAFT_513091 [Mycena polygramma]|nr:hypothetical protein DFH06DRAFT_513091 [Mycena polygramma]
MATFAKRTFDAARYAASRPTYPRSLFESILTYHKQSLNMPGSAARWDHALDLGCGTGQATVELLRPPPKEGEMIQPFFEEEPLGFNFVTGVDPSAKMIEQARAFTQTLGERAGGFEFVQSPAEQLGFLEDEQVDMVIAAQAAHWFDWERLWPELSRVLTYGGTAAFWVYSEFRLPQYPHLTPLITEYAQGTDPRTSLGPHWEAGRSILNNHLLDIAPPPTGWTDVNRVFFTGKHFPELPQPHLDPIMRRTMTWSGDGLDGYLRTFSALHRFHDAYPEDLQRADGDIATRFLRQLMAAAQVPAGPEGEAQEVEVEWPLALVIARKELDPKDPWRQRQVALGERVDVVRKKYEEKQAGLPPAVTLEDTATRLNDWVAVQGEVLEIVKNDLDTLPEDVDEPYDEDGGRERYIEVMDDQRMTLSWHLSFKESFDTALELALKTEREMGPGNAHPPSALARWLELMRARTKEVGGPLWEMDAAQAEEITPAQIAALTAEQVQGYEKAEALEAIVRVAEELAQAVPNEPISDLVRGLYISASKEVTKQVEYGDKPLE